MMLLTYALVVYVSYVVAFRQISIPIGVVLGILWLGECLTLPKIVGVGIVISGLALVVLN